MGYKNFLKGQISIRVCFEVANFFYNQFARFGAFVCLSTYTNSGAPFLQKKKIREESHPTPDALLVMLIFSLFVPFFSFLFLFSFPFFFWHCLSDPGTPKAPQDMHLMHFVIRIWLWKSFLLLWFAIHQGKEQAKVACHSLPREHI